MKVMGLVLVLGVVSAAQATTIQCQGTKVRQQGTVYKAHSHFVLNVSENTEAQGGAALSRWIGHVQIHGMDRNNRPEKNVSYYSQFAARDKEVLLSTLAPKARAYKDAKYFRFKAFKETASSYHDGGGMNGELVISKDALKSNEEFAAHYVFQSGDHMGGTLDLTCQQD